MAQVIKIKRNNVEIKLDYEPNIINSVLIIYINIKITSEKRYKTKCFDIDWVIINVKHVIN